MSASRVIEALAYLAMVAFIMALPLVWPMPVKAQESSCQFELVPTVLQLSAQSIPHKVLEPAERNRFVASLEHQIGFNFPDVRNVLLASKASAFFCQRRGSFQFASEVRRRSARAPQCAPPVRLSSASA